MRVVIVGVLLLQICLVTGCSLANTTTIDWNKLTGVWYHTIAFADPWSDVPKCRMFSPSKYHGDEIELLIHGVPRDGVPEEAARSYRQQCLFVHDGVYLPVIDQDMEEKKKEIDEIHTGGDSSSLEEITKKQSSFFLDQVSFSTDYDTYILEEQCRKNEDGCQEKVGWIFTRVPNPTEDQVSRLITLARERGIVLDLHETDCRRTTPNEYLRP